MIKVYDGTPKNEKSLCLSCRHATIVHGLRTTLIDCEQVGTYNRANIQRLQPVHRCSDYDDKAATSLIHMKEISWKLEPNKKTGKLGFAPPKTKEEGLYDPINGKEVW